MNKCYYRIVWENYPSDKTPLNEQNLNKIDVAANEMDNRIISLDTTKFDKSEAQLLVKYIEYDEDTGIFKITHYNGTSYTIDTLLEKLAINFDYDYQTQRLIIELSDGTVKYVDLSALITQYEFVDSETMAFSLSADGKVSVKVKDGSIQEKHLQPNYLADIKVEVAKAQASQTAAATSETNAKASENAAKASQTAAKTSEDNAAASATAAAGSATTATQKATDAANSASAAATSANNAKTSETNAKTSETNAASSKTAAATSATNAASSATTAGTKATEAADYAKQAQSYADGTGGVRQNEATDNAKYYYEQSKSISEGLAGALMPMGTIPFASLPSLADTESGWMYNISDSFTTNSNFKEGAGHIIPAGSNVYKTADGKWDILAGTPVTGVKGNSESSYRRGNVNLTPANIGALPENGYYGTCSTAAATAAKTVVCAGFELMTGAQVTVKFIVTNTAANPTLNVNNSGAKPIYYRGAAISAGYLAANRTYMFRYNGAQWDFVGDINTNTTYTANSLKVLSLYPEVRIPSNSDLNTYMTVGTYNTPNSTVSATVLNAPVTTAGFRLIVYNTYGSTGGYISQKADLYTGAEYTRYTTNNGETWTNWVQRKFTDTTYSNATQSAAGLQSAADKKKLDGIPADTQAQLDALSTDLEDLDSETVKKTISGSTYSSLAAFWKAVESLDASGSGCFIRAKISGWGPSGVSWCRAWCSYQNKVGNNSYAVAGNIVLVSGDDQLYLGKVINGINGYDDLAVSWYKIKQHSTFVKSGENAAVGLVPKPSTTAGTTKYLREDATWAAPPDTKVTQTDTSASGNYRVLLSGSANDTAETSGVRKSHFFYANPSTGAFHANGYERLNIIGKTLNLNSVNLSSGALHIVRYICTTTGGSANITNRPVTTEQPFILDVELVRWVSATDYITIQTYRNQANTTYDYVRKCTSGTWGNWVKRQFIGNDTLSMGANNLIIHANSGKGIYLSTSNADDPIQVWTAGLISSGSSKGTLVLYNGGGMTLLSASNTVNSFEIKLPSSAGTLAVASSDIRLKENIQETNVNALDLIDKIEFVEFDWKDKDKHQKLGVIADQLEELDPQVILDGTGGYEDDLDEDGNPKMNVKCLDLVTLTSYYGKAIQELHHIIQNQQKEIEELKSLIKTRV